MCYLGGAKGILDYGGHKHKGVEGSEVSKAPKTQTLPVKGSEDSYTARSLRLGAFERSKELKAWRTRTLQGVESFEDLNAPRSRT